MSGSDLEKNNDLPLTETAAPQPVEPVSSQRQQWHAAETPLTEEAPLPAATTPAVPEAKDKPFSQHATGLYTVSYLIFFAILGTLARLGLQALTFYTGAPVVTGVLWANVGGSLVMGFLIEDKNLFREEWGTPPPAPKNHEEATDHAKKHKAVKKTIPLYIGLTTGFCGCFTSFSSFMRDVFLALANALPDPSLPAGTAIASRNGGYSFMALVAVLLLTVSLSLSALIFGAHLALALTRVTPTVPFALTRRVLDRVVVVLGWGCWLGAVFLAIWPPDRHDGPDTWRGRAVFALVFAPLGCLLRFYVSLYLNSRIPSFPLGTFAVNMIGTAVEAMCYDLQHVSGLGAVVPAALTGCQVLQGVMDGFCGSLTTISTWVAELNGVSRRRHAYVYGVSSMGVGLALMVVIMGSLLWTRGFKDPVCG
ncbi:uncharacterized protein N7459_004878 [Penicillium hispanicum]|uniref:uncharacterized protein n=1 Tax=Penicillium hispanicum TaxID=1080232 RepID=UPI00254149EA|nr:uncharacterized protein N7459_004878 [Penicillium hispanicum]KAJ5585078.1 hypothetical protein N7459_004878 [Penicillium hispanicum]